MSDFTPSMDDIRARYVEAEVFASIAEGEFDRWLTQYEKELRESIASELSGRAAALYPLTTRKSAHSLTNAVHTTLLEAANVARGET